MEIGMKFCTSMERCKSLWIDDKWGIGFDYDVLQVEAGMWQEAIDRVL